MLPCELAPRAVTLGHSVPASPGYLRLDESHQKGEGVSLGESGGLAPECPAGKRWCCDLNLKLVLLFHIGSQGGGMSLV